MLCERARNLFSDYCEGALQPAMLMALENHLNVCEGCRTQVEEVRAVYAVLNEAPIVEPPADFRLRVWEKIDARLSEPTPAAKPRWSFDWRAALMPRKLGWSLAAAAVILLGAFVVPGRYTQAGLYFPWSLFAGANTWRVSAGQWSVAPNESGAPVLNVALGSGSPHVVTVDVSVRDNSGPVGEAANVLLRAAGDTTVTIQLTRALDGAATLAVRPHGSSSAHSVLPLQVSSRK